MMNLLDRILGREPNSARQAKERMKLVLIHDRTDLSPAALASLKDELIEGPPLPAAEKGDRIARNAGTGRLRWRKVRGPFQQRQGNHDTGTAAGQPEYCGGVG